MTARKRKPAPDLEPGPAPVESGSGADVTVTVTTYKTVTVTSARPGIRRVHADGHVFPVGEPVPNIPPSTIQALQGMPRVQIDVAGEPDADTPATSQE